MLFQKYSTGTITTSTAIAEVQTIDLGDISTADTFKLTYNAHETDAITYSADMSADITAALEGLADFEVGDVSVAKSSLTVYTVTFTGLFAGVNAGAITITSESGFTPVGVTETTSGRSSWTETVPVGSGRYGLLLGVRWGLFVNGSSNELLITDSRGTTIYSVTGKDTNVSGAKLKVLIGTDGKDQSGNALSNLGPTYFEGPLTVRVRNGSGTTSPASGTVELFVMQNTGSGQISKRTTGTLTCTSGGAASATLRGGNTIFRPLAIKLAGFDSSTDFTIVDANGDNVFTKTALDTTAGLWFPVGYDGEDQAGNAAADALPGIFQSPMTVTVANGGNATTGSVTVVTLS